VSELFAELDSYLEWGEDWNCEDAEAISLESVALAKEIIADLFPIPGAEFQVGPDPRGGVGITLRRGEKYACLTVCKRAGHSPIITVWRETKSAGPQKALLPVWEAVQKAASIFSP
jgi:hypothetical protein